MGDGWKSQSLLIVVHEVSIILRVRLAFSVTGVGQKEISNSLGDVAVALLPT
jgi:hypothetical protein